MCRRPPRPQRLTYDGQVDQGIPSARVLEVDPALVDGLVGGTEVPQGEHGRPPTGDKVHPRAENRRVVPPPVRFHSVAQVIAATDRQTHVLRILQLLANVSTVEPL